MGIAAHPNNRENTIMRGMPFANSKSFFINAQDKYPKTTYIARDANVVNTLVPIIGVFIFDKITFVKLNICILFYIFLSFSCASCLKKLRFIS